MFAQDKIYFKANKVEEWKVTAITPEVVKYAVAQNPGVSYSTNRSNVLFVFNSVGNLLVPSKLNDNASKADVYINNFLYGVNKALNEADRIITLQNNLITCLYDSENDKEIIYTINKKQAKIAKADVAVIIFKNGDHKLYADINKVYQALSTVQDTYNELAFGAAKPDKTVPENTAGNKAGNATTVSDKDVKVQNNPLTNTTDKKDLPVAKDNRTSPADGSNQSNQQTSVVKRDTTDITLDADTKTRLQELAIINTGELGNYMQAICNEADLEKARGIIDEALKLFYSDSAKVETTTLSGQKTTRTIRLYLNRLKLLKYTKVTIEWSNVQYATKLKLGPDGNYYGSIEFEQKFSGFGPDKKLVYTDVTRKKVEVIIKRLRQMQAGKYISVWDVFLGDIGVNDVRPA